MRNGDRCEILQRLNSLRTEDFRDYEAKFAGEPIGDVSQLVGTSVFLRHSSNEILLVEISEIELYRDFSRFSFLGKLIGDVKWGSKRWSKVNIDRSSLLQQNGWRKVETFDEIFFGVPDSCWRFYFEKLRLHRLLVKDYCLLTLTEVKGVDLNAGTELIQSVDVGAVIAGCPSVMTFDCVDWLCSESCQQSGDEPIFGDCDCPGYGFCAFWPMGTTCVNTVCSLTCHNLTGWAAVCLCI